MAARRVTRGAGPGRVRDPKTHLTVLGRMARAMRRHLNPEARESPEDRLRWIVQFAHRDLDGLRKEERTAVGDDLRLLAAIARPSPVAGTTGVQTSLKPLSGALLRAYQQEIRGGLRQLLAPDGGIWPLPGSPVLARLPQPKGQLTYRMLCLGDEHAGMLNGMARLIADAGERLRACRECGQPFVKRKRQEYCLGQCSMRVRNRTRLAKLRKG